MYVIIFIHIFGMLFIFRYYLFTYDVYLKINIAYNIICLINKKNYWIIFLNIYWHRSKRKILCKETKQQSQG